MPEVEELFAAAEANRLLAADMFAGLTEEQWLTPSLCAGWTVREVAAHLVPDAEPSTWRWSSRWCASAATWSGWSTRSPGPTPGRTAPPSWSPCSVSARACGWTRPWSVRPAR